MADHEQNREPDPDPAESVDCGVCALGVYRAGFQYRDEALRFFRARVGDDVYGRAMNSEAGQAHHYAVARAFLNQSDWEKFVWIEQYGSLDGFPD